MPERIKREVDCTLLRQIEMSIGRRNPTQIACREASRSRIRDESLTRIPIRRSPPMAPFLGLAEVLHISTLEHCARRTRTMR